MKIELQIFGQFQKFFESKSSFLEIPEGYTILDVFMYLTAQHGEEFEKLLFYEGKVRTFYTILINEQLIEHEELSKIVLKDNDKLVVIPYIAGG